MCGLTLFPFIAVVEMVVYSSLTNIFISGLDCWVWGFSMCLDLLLQMYLGRKGLCFFEWDGVGMTNLIVCG